MVKKADAKAGSSRGEDRTAQRSVPTKLQKPSALLDTRAVYCGDNLEQLAKLPDACVDFIRAIASLYLTPEFDIPPKKISLFTR